MSRSRSSDGLQNALPWPMRQVQSSLDHLSSSPLSASNPVGFRGPHRPLTPEQSTFVQGYSSRMARPPPMYTTGGGGLARAFGLGPDAPYARPVPMQFPMPFGPSIARPHTPTTLEGTNLNSGSARHHQDNTWRVSPDADYGTAYTPGNRWDGRTYGGVPTVERRREARASFAAAGAQTARIRPNADMADLLKRSKQQDPGWESSRSPNWDEWRVRIAGSPSGLGNWS